MLVFFKRNSKNVSKWLHGELLSYKPHGAKIIDVMNMK